MNVSREALKVHAFPFQIFRAVVWTDTLQFSAMVLAIIVVIFLGTNEVGGVANVFKVADEGGRLIWFE